MNIKIIAVRDAASLAECDALILPGGESTTMSRLCDRYELWQPLRERLQNGMPALGTCAGLILLSKNITGATRNFKQKTLGALDVDVARNAYGTQIESFETDLDVPILREANLGNETLRAIFIRAPRIERLGDAVETLASHDGHPVLVRQNKIFGAAFHPEIAGDARLHALWLRAVVDSAVR